VRVLSFASARRFSSSMRGSVWETKTSLALRDGYVSSEVEANAIQVDGIRSIFTDASKLVPFGLAVVIATVLNGLLPADAEGAAGVSEIAEHVARSPGFHPLYYRRSA